MISLIYDKFEELGADYNFYGAMSCDSAVSKLVQMSKAGFDVPAFLAKQTDFTKMCDEIDALFKVFTEKGETTCQ